MFAWPLALSVAGRLTFAPGAGILVGAMVLGWRLMDLKPKRAGSADFLRRHEGR